MTVLLNELKHALEWATQQRAVDTAADVRRERRRNLRPLKYGILTARDCAALERRLARWAK